MCSVLKFQVYEYQKHLFKIDGIGNYLMLTLHCDLQFGCSSIYDVSDVRGFTGILRVWLSIETHTKQILLDEYCKHWIRPVFHLSAPSLQPYIDPLGL